MVEEAAAAFPRALGHGKAYEHIRPQIIKVAERLEELGGISLMDSVYYRLEEVADRATVREVTLAWKSGLSGWTM